MWIAQALVASSHFRERINFKLLQKKQLQIVGAFPTSFLDFLLMKTQFTSKMVFFFWFGNVVQNSGYFATNQTVFQKLDAVVDCVENKSTAAVLLTV